MNRKTLEELAHGVRARDAGPSRSCFVSNRLFRTTPKRFQEVPHSHFDAAASFAAASEVRASRPIQRATGLGYPSRYSAITPQLQRKTAQTSAPNGYSFLLNSSEGWEDTDIPGFRTKRLSRGPHPGCEVMLIALAPGAKVPEHDHTGTEEIYMLSGHLRTEGQAIGPGDFLRAEAGTRHHELVFSPMDVWRS